MRLLDGRELAGFIQARQAKKVRSLKQSAKIIPRLAIVKTTDDPVSEIYIKLKASYAQGIGVEVDIHRVEQADIAALMKQLDQPDIQGIIIQLPLADPGETGEICRLIPVDKDVDGLNADSSYVSATATAVNWLLAGYGIDLSSKRIVILGSGKLVGKPLLELWRKAQLKVTSMDEHNVDWQQVKQADLLVTATGQAKLIQPHHLGEQAIVVDVGAQYVDGQLVGDVDPAIYQTRDDLTITPIKGGVGPLTICVLFENLLTAALRQVKDT